MPVDRTTAYGPDLELDIADRLLEIYSSVERQLAADIARRLRAGMDAPDWAERKLAEAGALRRAAQALIARLAVDDGTIAQALVLAYMRGGQAAAAEILRLGRQVPGTAQDAALLVVLDASGAGVQRALASAVRAFPGLGALQRMVWSLASRLSGTHLPVLRWAVDSYRDVVAEGDLAPVLLGVATRRAGTQRAWERLLQQGVKGFTDTAGRNWNLATYTEMATRTGVAQAAVEGHLDRLAAAKLDLVIVSNAPQECVRCRPWEGKVLARAGVVGAREVEMRHAITGAPVQVEVAGTVAEAIAAGLMHPNCRHSLSAYLPGLTRIPTNTEDPKGDAARQKLRALERDVRKARLLEAGALTPEAKKAATAKVRAGQAAIREHVAATRALGIMRKPERERINLGHTTAADAGRPARKPAAPKPKAIPARPAPMPVPEHAARYHRTTNGIEQLARAVEAGPPRTRQTLTGGVSAETELVTLADGTKAVRKVGGNPAAEQAASLIGRALGLRAPAVYRNDTTGVWMEYIGDAKPWDVLAATGADPARRPAAIESDAGKLIGLLDIMTVNADRNAGNWMLAESGEVVPIDHGHAYMVVPNIGGRPRPTFGGFGPFAAHFWDETGRRPGPNDLTQRDVEVLTARLEALRRDFELIGQTLWLDYALAVLRALAPHARGTHNLVGDAR